MANIVPQMATGQEETPEPVKPPSQDIAKIVHELLGRSKRASAEQRKRISDNYNFFVGGKQWSIDRPAWRFSEVVNVSLGTMLQEVGIQTDSRPKVDFVPQEPMDTTFVDTLKELNDRNWSKSAAQGFGWPNKLEEHILEVKYSDWSWAEICWDPTLEPPLGDIGWNKLDPTYCYWDPLATEVQELRWFIYIEPTPTEILKVQNPDKKEEIKSDMFPLSQGEMKGDHNVDRSWLVSALESGDMAHSFEKEDRFGGEPMTLKIRAWLRDSAVIEVAKEKDLNDPETEQVIERKLKYPKGRYVELAGNAVLEDRENGVVINGEVHPYEDGMFPIALLRNYSLPGKLTGLSEAGFLKGPQKIINYVWSYLLDNMKMSANPKVTVTPDAGELVDMMTNEPGAVFEVPRQDSVQFHPGQPIAAGLQNVLDTALSLMDKVQGIQEASRGAPQPGATSGLMLEGFVEASQTRPRLKNRNVDAFLSQIGFLMLSRIMQFYTAPRVTRIANPKEGWPEHLEFYIGQDPKGGKVANITPMGPTGMGNTQQIPISGMPDVIIQSGSALPYGRAQKQAMANEQLRLGAIDLETYLEDVGRNDAQKIIQRLDQQKAKEAQAQMPPGGPA